MRKLWRFLLVTLDPSDPVQNIIVALSLLYLTFIRREKWNKRFKCAEIKWSVWIFNLILCSPGWPQCGPRGISIDYGFDQAPDDKEYVAFIDFFVAFPSFLGKINSIFLLGVPWWWSHWKRLCVDTWARSWYIKIARHCWTLLFNIYRRSDTCTEPPMSTVPYEAVWHRPIQRLPIASGLKWLLSFPDPGHCANKLANTTHMSQRCPNTRLNRINIII